MTSNITIAAEAPNDSGNTVARLASSLARSEPLHRASKVHRENTMKKTAKKLFPMMPHNLNELWLDFLDMYSSAFIFVMYLVTLETVLVSAVSAATTLFYCRVKIDGHIFAANISWTFISFAVVFPLTYSIGEAFKRREQGLRELAGFKANLYNVCMAHTDWSWGSDPGKGRAMLPKEYVEEVKALLLGIVEDVREVLSQHHRPRVAAIGKGFFGSVLQDRGSKLLRRKSLAVCKKFQQLSCKVEIMKTMGLPGPEASRIRQFSMIALAHWENICMIKNYRTPRATRSFARVYIMLHPFFFGPYFAYVSGNGSGPSHTNEGFAVALAILTSIAMVGLFNLRNALEDPFNEVQGLLDAIYVQTELDDVVRAIDMFTTKGACRE